MKKKITVICVLAAIVCTACALAACKDRTPDPSGDHVHSYVESVVEPTCFNGGYILHTCECGDKYKTDETAALGHDYSEYVALDDERCYLKCSRCGDRNDADEHVMRPDGDGIKCELCGFAVEKTEAVTYKANSDGTGYIVTGVDGPDACVVIPETYLGKPVVGIATDALAYKEGRGWIRNLVLPSSLQFIESGALSDFRTNRTFFRGTVEQWLGVDIGRDMDNPFYHIASDEVWIHGECVYDIIIPNGVTEIKKFAFAGCRGLKSVQFPASLETIGEEAFYDCGGIKKLALPSGLTSMDKTAFKMCHFDEITSESAKYTIKNDCLIEIGTKTLLFALNADSTIPTDGSVRIIGEAAFRYSEVESVVIPSGVTEIRMNAFSECTKLRSLTIGSDVKTIGKYAFQYCTALRRVNIPGSVTKLDEGAFSSCYGLTSVTLESGLKNSSFANGGLFFSTATFDNCNNLYEVYNFTGITPTSSERTSDWGLAYANAKDIYTSATVSSKIKSTSDGFDYYDGDKPVLVGYTGSAAEITLPSKVAGKSYTVGAGAFAGSDLVKVSVPSGVEMNGERTFFMCDKLESVNISDGVVISDGSSMFQNSTALKSVRLPNGLTEIAYQMFLKCTSLESIVIPDSVKTFGNYVFGDCTSLETVVIGAGITNIPAGVFYSSVSFYESCTSLKSVEIKGDSVTIGENAFKELTELETVKAQNIAEVGENAFYGCEKLKSIDIKSASTIGYYAFYNCNELTTVDLSSATEIVERAFFYCSKLASVKLGENLTSIGDYAFYGACVDDLIIPEGVTTVGTQIIQRLEISDTIPNIWCEATEKPEGFAEYWDYAGEKADETGVYATVHWGGTWETVDGIPTAKQ